jgi:glycerol-3-phosphate dehydrogenase
MHRAHSSAVLQAKHGAPSLYLRASDTQCCAQSSCLMPVAMQAAEMIMPSVGVHVTLPDYYSPEHMGLIVPKTKDGRVVFMLPWQNATVAGTTGV